MGKFTRRDSERTAPVTTAAIEKPKQEIIRVDEIIKARLHDIADIFDISKLELQEIPLLDNRCSSVTTLISCKNPLIKFDGLQQFTSVKVLNLSGCGIENISVTGVLSLVYLQSLDLSRNSITTIPDDITSLYALEVLNLQQNKLEKLPATMNNLKYLRKLDLSYNKLSSVCDELEGMPRLEEVNFSGNPDLVAQNLGPDILRLFIQVYPGLSSQISLLSHDLLYPTARLIRPQGGPASDAAAGRAGAGEGAAARAAATAHDISTIDQIVPGQGLAVHGTH
eukprot:gene36322-48921_t